VSLILFSDQGIGEGRHQKKKKKKKKKMMMKELLCQNCDQIAEILRI
jgi:hypothetical protein